MMLIRCEEKKSVVSRMTLYVMGGKDDGIIQEELVEDKMASENL